MTVFDDIQDITFPLEIYIKSHPSSCLGNYSYIICFYTLKQPYQITSRGNFHAKPTSPFFMGWMLTKNLESKQEILNISWETHSTKCQLYGELLPASTTIKGKNMHFVGHCQRVKQELGSDLC